LQLKSGFENVFDYLEKKIMLKFIVVERLEILTQIPRPIGPSHKSLLNSSCSSKFALETAGNYLLQPIPTNQTHMTQFQYKKRKGFQV